MSGQVFGDAFAIIPEHVLYSDVSSNAVRLYGIFARHADPEGRAYPGLKRLAELMKCSEDTIRRAKKELVDAGFVTTEIRTDTEGRRVSDNVYLQGAPRKSAARGGSKVATRTRTNRTISNGYAAKTSAGHPDGDPRNLQRGTLHIDSLEDLPERHVIDIVDPRMAKRILAGIRQRDVDG